MDLFMAIWPFFRLSLAQMCQILVISLTRWNCHAITYLSRIFDTCKITSVKFIPRSLRRVEALTPALLTSQAARGPHHQPLTAKWVPELFSTFSSRCQTHRQHSGEKLYWRLKMLIFFIVHLCFSTTTTSVKAYAMATRPSSTSRLSRCFSMWRSQM